MPTQHETSASSVSSHYMSHWLKTVWNMWILYTLYLLLYKIKLV
jgi:hypothetical protein